MVKTNTAREGMRVAICAPLELASAGGVEVHIRRMCHALRELGVEADAYGKTGGAEWKALEALEPERYSIVHTHGSAFSSRFIGYALRRRGFQRHVHTLHGVSADYLPACGAWGNWRCYSGTLAEWAMARYADYVITVSESVRKRAVRLFGLRDGRCTAICNGHAMEAVSGEERAAARKRFGLQEGDFAALFVGRGEDRVKGTDTIAEAMERLYGRHRNVRLLAAPGEEFAEAGWLIRAGRMGADEVRVCYAAGDVFVNASRNEGMPLTVLEAMGCGLAVIAARVGGIGEIVRDGENGLLLDSGRTNLAEQLERLMKDEGLRRRLGEAGRMRAEGLTWEAAARRTMEVYENVRRDGIVWEGGVVYNKEGGI